MAQLMTRMHEATIINNVRGDGRFIGVPGGGRAVPLGALTITGTITAYFKPEAWNNVRDRLRADDEAAAWEWFSGLQRGRI